MQILGLPLLEAFKRLHADSRGQLDAWRAVVEGDDWKTPHDIRRRYASADFLPGNLVIFNIKGNCYRLVVRVRHHSALVVVEWVDTHAEYGKKKFWTDLCNARKQSPEMAMKLKIIKSTADYEAAMARLSALMALEPVPGCTGADELELLALLIADHERKTVAPVQADPVEVIVFYMQQMGLTRSDLVPYLGSASRVSEVLARKRRLSLNMMRRLHRGLGIPAEVLLQGGAEERIDAGAEAAHA